MKNKEKQIEEMAKVMCGGCPDNKECMHCLCADWYKAESIYNAGYRKASDVARDLRQYIILNEDITLKCKQENGEKNEEYWKGKLSAFKQIRAYIDAELKKKYTEESGNDR